MTYPDKYAHTAVYYPEIEPREYAPIDLWRGIGWAMCLLSAFGVIGLLMVGLVWLVRR